MKILTVFLQISNENKVHNDLKQTTIPGTMVGLNKYTFVFIYSLTTA